jgi:catechol 2,3-dioxygenase-like lactoylglutathione lyase family enzyme
MLAIDHVQIAMPAGGEGAARGFFGDVLGLTEIPKPADMAARGGCWFEVGGLQIHIGVEADFRAAKKAHVALRTNDLVGLRQRLATAGFVLTDDAPVNGHDRFFTADPFGNRIEFVAA